MQKTIGGDRLGSGAKMTVDLHNYGRSTHNLSRAWRSSMTPGTLIPFLVEPALNGDIFDIDIAGLVRTAPTLGPLFGSFKLQMDIFVAPMRLYNKQLHNNKLGIGMEMNKVIFPKISMLASKNNSNHLNPNAQQINPSSIFAYLGIRGLGQCHNESTRTSRTFDAQPFLAYWDIFKNYYANKQEANAYVIEGKLRNEAPLHIYQITAGGTDYWKRNDYNEIILPVSSGQWNTRGLWLYYANYSQGQASLDITNKITFVKRRIGTSLITEDFEEFTLQELMDSGAATTIWQQGYLSVTFTPTNNPFGASGYEISLRDETNELSSLTQPQLRPFALTNIDAMRETILSASTSTPFTINSLSGPPYASALGNLISTNPRGFMIPYSVTELAGIAIKTYQSDRFNNWINEDWIGGANGINEITKIDTSDGLKIDALNLAQKVYNMLNRIAVSGGSYHDWQEAVYGEKVNPIPETPWFAGGTSQEITFSEVTATAESSDEVPLGTLASKGYSQNNSKRIHINIVEPSFIIGIVSITPRIDYSQGNKWFVNLETMDDLHKPALDGIGFQELITDEMHAWSTIVKEMPAEKTFLSAGRQPSWIHYMTSQNECYANFAMPDMEMYMTLNRNYEMSNNGTITDLTTYIDPEKFNNNFARKDLGAMNFWVQLGIDVIARRKMSAKQIPNL